MDQAYKNFEETFNTLLAKAKKGSVTVHTLLTILSGKGKVLLLIFLSLGFTQIPGIAIVLGLFIAYLGIRIAISKSSIWCPKFLLRKKISSFILTKLIKQTLVMLRWIRHWSKPRYKWTTKRITRIINGSVIAFVGICIACSPPIPLTGILASVAIFFIAIGFLNWDGLYILIGYFFSFSYFVLVLLLLRYASIPAILEWIKGIFS